MTVHIFEHRISPDSLQSFSEHHFAVVVEGASFPAQLKCSSPSTLVPANRACVIPSSASRAHWKFRGLSARSSIIHTSHGLLCTDRCHYALMKEKQYWFILAHMATRTLSKRTNSVTSVFDVVQTITLSVIRVVTLHIYLENSLLLSGNYYCLFDI